MVALDSSPASIARATELTLLDAAFARAVEGRPSLVVVGGEAGIGKTRLLQEFEARLGDRACFLVGRCYPALGGGLPYAPFADLFRTLEDELGRDRLATVLGPAPAKLGLVVPEMGSGLDPAAPDPNEGSRRVSRAQLFELVLGIAHRVQRS